MKRENGEGISPFSFLFSADTRDGRVSRYCEDTMRYLFLPACFCLMTVSGSAGADAGISLEQLSGATATEKKTVVGAAEVTTSADDDKDGQAPSVAVDEAVDSSAPALPDAVVPLPLPRPVVSPSNREICDSLIEAAQRNDLPIPFFIHLLVQESGFRSDVVSHAGAQGIAQFMPETAATVGLDNPFDPLQAIAASARLLRNLAKQFGNLGLAAAAYNAGPRRIQDWLAKKGKLPEETQNYVKTITGRAVQTWTSAAPRSLALALPRHAPCREAIGMIAWNSPPSTRLRPGRSALDSSSLGAAMLAARARVKLARFSLAKRPKIMVAEASGPKSAKAGAGQSAKPVKDGKDPIQLAAANRKTAHRKKLQLSQQ